MALALRVATFIGMIAGGFGLMMLLIVNKAWVASLIWSLLITPLIGVEPPAIIVLFAAFLIIEVGSLKTIKLDANKTDKEHVHSILITLIYPYLSLWLAWLASLAI